ncbi:aminotransferase class I/II-fold pyridoxal phosphate-dependent enzyme [Micromonospora sp. NPDC047134]|uniref:aminotransferase class I/II-fold pyridoxal phosphate-dependent enzyme n=1 Tax=Micromonospora sp. NPDC047134 TaxID=3154340 RepID=UPI0033D98F7A
MTVDALSQLQAARKVLAAVEAADSAGVFDAVLDRPHTLGGIAERLELSAEPLHALLRVLSWNGVLCEQDGEWSVTDQWRSLLGGPVGRTRRPLLRVESWAAKDHLNAEGLVAALRGKQRPSEIPDHQVPDLAGAMLAGARASAPHIARLPELRSRRSLGDVAGGSAGYAVTLCRMFPGLTATVYDRPPMLEHAVEVVAAEGMPDRIALKPWNLHTDAIDTGHDVVLLSHILHLLDAAARVDLLSRVREALDDDGVLVVHDFLYDQPPAGSPLAASAVDWLSLGAVFHADRDMLAEELDAAGFTVDRTVPIASSGTALTVAAPRQRGGAPRRTPAEATTGTTPTTPQAATTPEAGKVGDTAPKPTTMPKINIFQPMLGGAELDAVAEVFESGWLGAGPRTLSFEAAFADHLGVNPADMIFISSCTAGLFAAIDLIDINPGDEIVLPSISFVADANAIVARGGRPVFCDVDPRTLNARLADVDRVLTERTRAVLLLHYGGYPGEIAQIAQRCRERGITLIEDAACAAASRVDGRACGTFGDISVWSFDAMKLMTTGDGGMLYVPDPELNRRARRLVYHGLDGSAFTKATKATRTRRWWELNVQDVGYRAIGNDLTAAIGSVQLRRLADFVERRRQIAAFYDQQLASEPGLELPPPLPPGHESSYYFYWVQMDAAIRDEVAAQLYQAGVYTTFKYAPLHRIPLYGGAEDLPNAEQAADRTLCLPLHPALDDEAIATVVSELRKALRSCR